jgi:hypothetical protein
MSERDEFMRGHNIYACPDWCAQPDDENDYEAHTSEITVYTTAAGQGVGVRLLVGWWEGDEEQIIIRTQLDNYNELDMTFADWAEVTRIGNDLIEQHQADGTIWAYDGAEHDAYRTDDGGAGGEEDYDVIDGEVVDDPQALDWRRD